MRKLTLINKRKQKKKQINKLKYKIKPVLIIQKNKERKEKTNKNTTRKRKEKTNNQTTNHSSTGGTSERSERAYLCVRMCVLYYICVYAYAYVRACVCVRVRSCILYILYIIFIIYIIYQLIYITIRSIVIYLYTTKKF